MYENNSSNSISPASLTKLMTALLLYESNALNKQIITRLPKDYVFSGKVAYLEEGLILTTEELLELLLVYSANDAAYVAAMDISSNIDDFTIKIGCTSSNSLNSCLLYTSPSPRDRG